MTAAEVAPARFREGVLAGTDPLTDLLDGLRLQASIACRTALAPPFGLWLPGSERLALHAVVRGIAWLTVTDPSGAPAGAPLALGPGDVVVVPAGASHAFADRPGRAAVPMCRAPYRSSGEGAGVLELGDLLRTRSAADGTHMVSGYFWYRGELAAALRQVLPDVLRVPAGAALPAAGALQQLAAGTQAGAAGDAALLTRLAEGLVVAAVREYLRTLPADGRGWPAALADPQIGPALGLLLRDPAVPWTVASLARRVAMSRTGFAERFTLLVGTTPRAFLTERRMLLATELLRDRGAGVLEVAHAVGYGSEAAFSRAFKRRHAVPPAAYRRRHAVATAVVG